MPYVSDRQRRWAHTDEAQRKGFPTAEFDQASKGMKLPERSSTKKPRRPTGRSFGGKR